MALTFLYALVLCACIYRSRFYRVEGLDKRWLVGAFMLKVLAGIALWAVYSFYYADAPRDTLDTFKYFDDAGYFHAALSNNPTDWFRLMFNVQLDASSLEPYYEGMNNWDRSDTIIAINDNRTMIRLNALIRLISFGEYHVHSLLFNFLGFTGLLLLYKGLRRMVKMPAWLFIVAFILPPSLLFWASGVLKECLVLFAMGVFINAFSKWWTRRQRPVDVLLILVGLLLFVSIKPYVLLAFIPGLLFLMWCRPIEEEKHVNLKSTSKSTSFFFKWSVVHVFILIGLWFSRFHHKLDLVGILRNKRDAFVNVVADTGASSGITIPTLDSYWELLAALPSAIFTCLFRPTLLEAGSAILLMSALENTVYVILIFAALIYRRKSLDIRILLFCLSVVLTLSAIVGLVTPVLGAIVRYKVPMLPFLLLMTFLVLDLDRLPLFSSFLRRLKSAP